MYFMRACESASREVYKSTWNHFIFFIHYFVLQDVYAYDLQGKHRLIE